AHEVADGAISQVDSTKVYWSPTEQRMRDDNRALLRRVLGEDEFERSYAIGAALSFDKAVDLALGRVRSP
ncbi:MAG TPA: hypothetical protein VGU73_04570, partial [Acidimicrobiia bacterium]|nr:hypothetical protein [Acidimicrobiia bacterium]